MRKKCASWKRHDRDPSYSLDQRSDSHTAIAHGLRWSLFCFCSSPSFLHSLSFSAMSVRVLYFARSREIIGRSQEDVPLDAIRALAQSKADGGDEVSATATAATAAAPTVSQLLAYLVHHHPSLQSLVECTLLALNQEFIQPTWIVSLADGDEVAFIQPISGG